MSTITTTATFKPSTLDPAVRKAYDRGWRFSTYTDGDLDDADSKGYTSIPGWIDGYMDAACSRPRWHSAWCRADNHDLCDDEPPTPVKPTRLPIKLGGPFLMDASPAFDDAREYPLDGLDTAYVQLRPVVALIDAATEAKDYSVVIHVDLAEAKAIASEAKYRGEAARDRAADAWDSSDRMQMFGLARSADAVLNRARKVIAELSS